MRVDRRPDRWKRVALVTAVLAVVAGGVAVASRDGAGTDPVAALAGEATTSTSRRSTTTTSTSTSTTTTTAPSTTAAPTTGVPTTAAPTTGAPPPPTTGAPPAPTAPPDTPPPAPPAPTTTPPAPPPGGVLCIGDSVMLGAGPQFQNTLTMCSEVDATQNRQFHEADDVLRYYRAFVGLPPTVVIALGNNGYITSGEIDAAMLELAGVSRVVLVTIQLSETREWQGPVNAELRAAPGRYAGQVVIADWEAASNGHPEYFGGDGIHIVSSPAGAQAYAATIGAAI